jgi:hypothetical protein
MQGGREGFNIELGAGEPCVNALDENVNEGFSSVERFASLADGFIHLGPPWEALGVFAAEEMVQVFDVVVT